MSSYRGCILERREPSRRVDCLSTWGQMDHSVEAILLVFGFQGVFRLGMG